MQLEQKATQLSLESFGIIRRCARTGAGGVAQFQHKSFQDGEVVKLNSAEALGLHRAPIQNQYDEGLRHALTHKLFQPVYGLFNVLAELRVTRPVLAHADKVEQVSARAHVQRIRNPLGMLERNPRRVTWTRKYCDMLPYLPSADAAASAPTSDGCYSRSGSWGLRAYRYTTTSKRRRRSNVSLGYTRRV